jgi:hypothetical protein
MKIMPVRQGNTYPSVIIVVIQCKKIGFRREKLGGKLNF